MTSAPPDPNALLDGPSGPSAPARTPARLADADWTLLQIMWERLGWPEPVRDYAEIERNPGGRSETEKRRPRVVPPGRDVALLYYSPTNTAKLPSDKYLLNQWGERQVAIGTALDPGLQDLIIAKQDDRDAMNGLVKRAKSRAKSDEGADRGTARHDISAKIDFGLDPGRLPDGIRADLDAYRHATRNLDMVLGEVFVVDDQHKMGGTLDRIAYYQGRYYIVDLKPPDNGFGQDERAIQFAIYSRALAYNWNLAQHLLATNPKMLPTTNLRAELPQPLDQERAIMVHVPRGGIGRAFTAWVDIRAGWEGFQHALWQRRWQSRDYRESLVTPFEPAERPTVIDTKVVDLGSRRGTNGLPPQPPETPDEVTARVAAADQARPGPTAAQAASAQVAAGLATPPPERGGARTDHADQERAAAAAKIARSMSRADLLTVYAAHKPVWTPELTDESKARLAEIAEGM